MPVCADGWHSPSIGRSGACSHHGGVHQPYAWLALLGSITGGIAVGLLTARIEKKWTTGGG